MEIKSLPLHLDVMISLTIGLTNFVFKIQKFYAYDYVWGLLISVLGVLLAFLL